MAHLIGLFEGLDGVIVMVRGQIVAALFETDAAGSVPRSWARDGIGTAKPTEEINAHMERRQAESSGMGYRLLRVKLLVIMLRSKIHDSTANASCRVAHPKNRNREAAQQ
jgi:hypothetical protein